MVDGEDVSHTTLDKLVHKMRTARPGVMSTSRSGGNPTEDLLAFDLVRQVIHVPSVASRTLEGDVGYIRLKQFQEKTRDELLRAAAKLRSEGKGSLPAVSCSIFGNNPGARRRVRGSGGQQFLDAGTIYTTKAPRPRSSMG